VNGEDGDLPLFWAAGLLVALVMLWLIARPILGIRRPR
jgi:hypothetical protein